MNGTRMNRACRGRKWAILTLLTACLPIAGILVSCNPVTQGVIFGYGMLALRLLSPTTTDATDDAAGQDTPDDGTDEPGTGQDIPAIVINCWDLNGNGENDADEDTNLDGVWDALDCRGAQGPAGADGQDGEDGEDGLDGADGTDGADGADGATGPEGPEGPTGPAGPGGPAGPEGTGRSGGSDTVRHVHRPVLHRGPVRRTHAGGGPVPGPVRPRARFRGGDGVQGHH